MTANLIWMLWLRQLKRYFRSRARVAGALGQPLLFLLVFGFGFGPIFRQAGQGDYMQFLAPGVVCMTILFAGIFSGFELISDRQFGFLKVAQAAPVSRLTIMVGRTLGGASVASIQGLLVSLACVIAGFRPGGFGKVAQALAFMALVAVLFTALGITIASSMEDFQAFQLIMNVLVVPVFFLSGALFPLADLPRALKLVATVDPLSYGIDGLRSTLTGFTQFGVSTDLGVLSALSALLLVAGSYLFSRIQL